MIENQKQFMVTKSQMQMLQEAVASFDIDQVTKKVGSREMADACLKSLQSQIDDLSAELQEYENGQKHPGDL